MVNKDLSVLRAEVAKEKEKVKEELEKEKLEKELFELRNVEEIKRREKGTVRREKFIKVIKKGGRGLVKGLQKFETQRSAERAEQRIRDIQGVGVGGVAGKKSKKKKGAEPKKTITINGQRITFGGTPKKKKKKVQRAIVREPKQQEQPSALGDPFGIGTIGI